MRRRAFPPSTTRFGTTCARRSSRRKAVTMQSDQTVAADPVGLYEQALLKQEAQRVTLARHRERVRVIVLRSMVITAILTFWWAASGTIIDRLFFSDPVAVVSSLVTIAVDGTLWWHLERTLLEMTLGYIVGVVGGVGLAILV